MSFTKTSHDLIEAASQVFTQNNKKKKYFLNKEKYYPIIKLCALKFFIATTLPQRCQGVTVIYVSFTKKSKTLEHSLSKCYCLQNVSSTSIIISSRIIRKFVSISSNVRRWIRWNMHLSKAIPIHMKSTSFEVPSFWNCMLNIYLYEKCVYYHYFGNNVIQRRCKK